MSDVTATIVLSIPGGVHVGDTFDIAGKCRVVAIRDELVDVTTLGGTRNYAPGERQFELLITGAKVVWAP